MLNNVIEPSNFSPLNIKLMEATSKGELEDVRVFLQAGADVNTTQFLSFPHPGKRTPLNVAAYMGHTAVVRELLTAPGIKVDTKADDGRTALHRAAGKGHVEIVVALLQAGSEVNAVDNTAMTALHLASSGGHLTTVQTLLRAPHIELNSIEINYNNTPLQMAAEKGHTDVVETLIAAGALYERTRISSDFEGDHHAVVPLLRQPSAQLSEHQPPPITNPIAPIIFSTGRELRDAAKTDKVPDVKYLIAQENITALDKGDSLILAAKKGNLHVVQVILTHSDISPDSKGKALKYAAKKGYLYVVEVILTHSDISLDNKRKALKYAAKKRHSRMVLEFLMHLDLNEAKEFIARTYLKIWQKTIALLIAANHDPFRPLVQIFLDDPSLNEAILTDPSIIGRVLKSAASGGQISLVKEILLRPEITNSDINDALIAAAENARLSVVQLLLPHPAITDRDKEGARRYLSETRGILISASKNGDIPLVKEYLTRPEITNSDIKYAFIVAAKNRQLAVVQLLLPHSAITARDQYSARMELFEYGIKLPTEDSPSSPKPIKPN